MDTNATPDQKWENVGHSVVNNFQYYKIGKEMNITEWLSAQKKLLEAATPDEGICPVCKFDTNLRHQWECEKRKLHREFLSSVRTEHERALKLIEKYREALNSIPILDTDIESETIRSEALAYFPSDEEEKHNAVMDEISDKWGGSET